MKIVNTLLGVPFIWIKWGKKYRWMSFEFGGPVWWKPIKDHYSFGSRRGWLWFAFGTGVVKKETMETIIEVTTTEGLLDGYIEGYLK